MSTLYILILPSSRQTLTLTGTGAGPLEAAGKDVPGVVKSIDAKLAAVGVVAEKVKTQCKGCPSVSSLPHVFRYKTDTVHFCTAIIE